MLMIIILYLFTLSYIAINRADQAVSSLMSDFGVDAFLKKLNRPNENKSNSSIQGCSFFGYDFSYLNQNNGTDYVGTDVGVITNTYKMNICGPVNDNRCQYSWRIPTSICYICTHGNPHCLGSVTLIGSFGADGAGVAWNFIDPQKPKLGVTMTYINGQNPCFCLEEQHCLPATVATLQCAEQTEQTFRVFVNTSTCVTYLYLNVKCPE